MRAARRIITVGTTNIHADIEESEPIPGTRSMSKVVLGVKRSLDRCGTEPVKEEEAEKTRDLENAVEAVK
jgi:hypothetical protein